MPYWMGNAEGSMEYYIRSGKTQLVLSVSQTLSGLKLMQPTCVPAGSSSNMLRRRGPICCSCRVGTPYSYMHRGVINYYTSHGSDIRLATATRLSAFNHTRSRAAAAAINFPADSALVSTLLLPWPWPDSELCGAVLIAEIKQRIPGMMMKPWQLFP